MVKYSNGTVIKYVNIVVDRGITANGTTTGGKIEINESSALAFPSAKAYGAIIGQVLGGDNIIDTVSVAFTNTTIELSNDKQQLVPVGGYIGVIEKGGVYFRGMSSLNAADIQGLTSAVNSHVAENDNQYLYVNPIVGRVINGFAVTESSAYRPFEKGTRTYKGSGTDNTVADNNGSVTMQNNNKHYSITDVYSGLNKLETNGTDGMIEVPNGQAFFVMSLIVNSGMSNKSLGYNANYQMSRWANYNNIGSDAVNTTGSDYLIAHDDLIKSNTTDKRRGYLMHTYSSGDTDISSTAKNIKLTTQGGEYILPDGYKGIGNIFNNADAYHMKVSTFDGNGAKISQNTTYYYYPGYGTDSTRKVDIELNGINGTKKDANFDRYYQPYLVNSDDGRGGLGLFNYITNPTPSGATEQTVCTFKNVKLTGNVETNIIHYSTGEHIPYTTAYLAYENGSQRRILSAGSLIGCYDGNLTLNSVALDDVYIFSPKNTGGLLGYFPNNWDLLISNTEAGLGSDKIIVESGLNAGGIVGKKQQGTFVFDNANSSGKACSFNITRVASLCESMTNALFYNYGVGGIIGVSRGTNSSTSKATLKNFTMGSTSQSALNFVKCENANIYTGGLFGIMNRQYLEVDNCTVYNMSVKSQLTAGGIVGQWLTAGANAADNIANTTYASVINNTELICNLDNAEISSTGAKFYDKDQAYAKVDDAANMKFCSAGGFIGSAKEDMPKVTIKNSKVEGYKISGQINSGGIIGIWGDASTTAGSSDGAYDHNLILNNISVLDCSIESDTTSGFSGGLVGRIDSVGGNRSTSTIFNVSGYNILARDLSFSGSANGYICGKMTYLDNSIIKIAGFSKQDTASDGENSMIQENIGERAEDADGTKIYGEGGYVIFADYDGKAISNHNDKFSNVVTSGENPVERIATGAKQVTTDYTIIAQRDSSGNLTVVDIASETEEEDCEIVPVLGENEERVISSEGSRLRYTVATTETIVNNATEMKGNLDGKGFYLRAYNNSYFTNEISKVIKLTTDNSKKAVWYFEADLNNEVLY